MGMMGAPSATVPTQQQQQCSFAVPVPKQQQQQQNNKCKGAPFATVPKQQNNKCKCATVPKQQKTSVPQCLNNNKPQMQGCHKEGGWGGWVPSAFSTSPMDIYTLNELDYLLILVLGL